MAILIEGTNAINVQLVSIALPFDPWVYDLNGDGYIDDNERLKATQDYFDLIITKQQMLQVLNLPSPPASPPPPPPECATKAEKLKAAQDYFAGIITKEEARAVANLPTCP